MSVSTEIVTCHWAKILPRCCLAGASSAALVKRLKGIVQCLAELPQQGITTGSSSSSTAGEDEGTPSVEGAARAFQRRVLDELPGLVLQTGEAVRHHVAECALAFQPQALFPEHMLMPASLSASCAACSSC